MGRIAAIKQSLRAFACGLASTVLVLLLTPVAYAVYAQWWSLRRWHAEPGDLVYAAEWLWGCHSLALLVPLLTMLPAVTALFCWARIARRYKGGWNPASAYLSAGVSFGLLGFGLSLVLACALVIACDWPG